MRKQSKVLTLMVAIIIAISPMNIFASPNGFITEELYANEEESLLENIKITLLSQEPEKVAIQCFAVDDNMIAIGTQKGSTKNICIYDLECNFIRGYKFEDSGTFGVDLIDNSIVIYLVRSDIAIYIDENAHIQDIKKISDCAENTSYWNNAVYANEREVGEKKYILKNDMSFLNFFASSYSQLFVIDESGEEKILYDVNSSQLLQNVLIFIGISIFVLFVALYLFMRIRKNIKSAKAQEDE